MTQYMWRLTGTIRTATLTSIVSTASGRRLSGASTLTSPLAANWARTSAVYAFVIEAN